MSSSHPSSYDDALRAIETAVAGPDPDAPSCHQYRLRPSEEAEKILQKYSNPPPPWGIKIDLCRSFIGPSRCLAIGHKMILNKSVSYLDLSMCDMQQDVVVEFFGCMKLNSTLQHLNLNGNFIGDVGAIAAAGCLPQLVSLHLSSNGISDVGATALATALTTSTKTKTLNLRNNNITAVGLCALMNALEPFPSNSPDIVAATSSSTERAPRIINAELTERDTEVVCSTLSTEGCGSEMGVKQADKMYNTSLHTLWIQCNDNLPEEMLSALNVILSKRYPQIPKGVRKKKVGKKSKKR